jgi:hypothetical protein
MSSYLEMGQPTQAEINRGIISKYGPLLRQNKRYGSETASLLNSTRSNKEKKQGLINILSKRQKDPSGFLGGGTRRRSTHYRRSHRRRTHKRRTSRS